MSASRRAAGSCLFCAISQQETAGHVVLDEPELFAFLDNRPVFKGHTLLVPRRHVDTLLDLPEELHGPFLAAARRLARAMENALGAGGSFVAMNNRVSQSVPHLHLHVVPRTKGDGLRGFFWPRVKYASDEERESYGLRIREQLG